MASPIAKTLKQATRDVLFTSEADYPFTVVTWPEGKSLEELTPRALLEALDRPSDTPVETLDFADFYPALDAPEPAGSEEDERYDALMRTLKDNLKGIRVFRIGTVEIDIFILGHDPDGHIAGVSTKAVET